MNCIDNECKHLLHTWDCELYCNLTHKEVPEDIDIVQCDNFEQARTCINCTHSIPTVYETGTIDDIEYRCPFQEKKLMYDDLDPMNSHYADVPECNIDKFENNFDFEEQEKIKFPWEHPIKYLLGEMNMDDVVNKIIEEYINV